MVWKGKPVKSNKIDSEIDFNQLVLNQMNRCNESLTEGKQQFINAVMGLSCILAHLKQRDKIYPEEMKYINAQETERLSKIRRDNYNKMFSDVRFNTSIKEYEILVRLCARHGLLPSKRGGLETDEFE